MFLNGISAERRPISATKRLKRMEQVCAAEMAVRYAALCASRKVHTSLWPISENRSFSILDVRS